MVLAIVGFFLAIPVIMIIAGMYISAPGYRGPESDHFDGVYFRNPGGVRAKGGMDLLRWMINRKRGPWKRDLTEHYGKHPLGHFKDGIRVTFVNHSTFLIQVGELNILTDPVWSTRVSPFTWIGPRRMRLPGIRFGDLPNIHLVILSHNHYDHLDIETMRMVFGAHHPQIITPLGVGLFLRQHYVSGVTETDWWQEVQLNDRVSVQAVPAQHFSGRGFLDRDKTLWCGYVIKSPAGNIYFAGDTGYNDVTFKEIRARCGPIRVSLLPIGAYQPRWFMSPIHVSPRESVKIHTELGAETSIAAHYGTFPLADDGELDPVNDLQDALKNSGISADAFILLKEGDFRVFE